MPPPPTCRGRTHRSVCSTKAGGALHYTEIASRILDRGLEDSTGATLADSVNAMLATSIKRNGLESPFLCEGAGIYRLRDAGVADDNIDITSGPVAAFRIHWRRDLSQWTSQPRLLGRQHAKADQVDLADQRGV